MPVSKKVFLEPSVILAFIDRAHPKHEQACAFFRYFAEAEYQLFTDSQSIVDVYMQIYQNISPSLAKDFLRTLSLSDINIIYPDEHDTKAALKTLISYQSTNLPFPKALVATLADRRNIPQICTFDYFPNLFGLIIFYLPL